MGEIPTPLVEKVARAIYAQAQATYAKAAPGWDKAGQHVKMAMIGDAQAALAIVWPAIEAAQRALREGAAVCAVKKQPGAPCEIFTKIRGCCPDCPAQWVEELGAPLASLGLDRTT